MRSIFFFCFLFLLQGFSLSTSAALLPASFSAPDIISGKETKISIGENQKGLVVVFISAVCPCSDSHLKELVSLAKEYPEFTFVGIHSNTDEEKASTVDYFKKAALPFKVLQDRGAKIADQFKALKTPHAFVLKKDGDVFYQGGVSSSRDFDASKQKFLREALDDLHHNREVRTPLGRTLGCVISRGGKNVW